MADVFLAPQPGLCKVCDGKIDISDPIMDIQVPGLQLTRWAHKGCAGRVNTGALTWQSGRFLPAVGLAAKPVVNHEPPRDSLFDAEPETPKETPPADKPAEQKPAAVHHSEALQKVWKEMVMPHAKEIAKHGYVCKVGAVPVPGEDIWLYGGSVSSSSLNLDSFLRAPRSQFSGQDEADKAAILELADKLLAARDKAPREERSKLADLLVDLNALGQGTTGGESAPNQSGESGTESPAGVETPAPNSTTGSAGTEPEKPKKGGRGKKKADAAAAPEPQQQQQPAEAGGGQGDSQEACPFDAETPTPQQRPAPDGETGGSEQDPPFDPLLLALDRRVRIIVSDFLKNHPIPVAATLDVKGPQGFTISHVPLTALPAGKIPAVRHEKFDLVMQLVRARQNVMLIGPSQSGKTTMAEQIAEASGLPFYSFGCSIGMTEAIIKGRYVPSGENGKFEFQDTVFVKAFEHGGLCLVDEIDAAAPEVAVVMNAPLSNNWMSIEARVDNPKAMKHPDFVCVASANTWGHGSDRMYVGRQQLDFATLMRFDIGQVEIGYSPAIEAAVCPDDGLRKLLTDIRGAIDSLNAAAPFSIRRAVGTSFLKKAYQLRQQFGWDDKQILAQLYAGWTKAEVERVVHVVEHGGKVD
jgi:hypothetical protein